MFDPDKAIKSCNEDGLGRSNFAKSLGKAILEYNDENSLVISLLGKWGYGKTSIINMATEYIKESSEEPTIIEFNPWLFSNQNQLIRKFFDELSINIEDNDIKERLKSYVNKLIPPIIGLASVIDPARTQVILKSAEYFDDTLSEEESLVSIKNNLNALLCQKNQKIIVVIDDIDRLHDFEILQVFQLVKLLADFPNIIYLLSFDRSVVIKALDKVQEGAAEEYLEKIVQIPFDVPKIDENELEQLFFKYIYEIISEEEKRFDKRHFLNLYYHGMKYFFRSIRDVKRYINNIKFSLNVVKDEVNIADFLAITCIQVFEPEVYYGIRNNEDLFAGIFHFQVIPATSQPEEEYAKKRCEEIINNAPENLKNALSNLLYQLFPKIYGLYTKSNYGSDWLDGWRKELRICSPEHFNTYFRFSIPKNEIPLTDFESILSLADKKKSFESALVDLNERGKINQFLRKFMDYTEEIPLNNIKNVIYTLIKLGDEFPDGYSGFGRNNTELTTLIITSLLKRLDNLENRFKTLKEAILASNSLYTIIDVIYDREYEFENSDKLAKFDLLITEKHLNELRKIGCSKIESWAEDGKLIKSENLSTFLVFWQKWNEDEKVKKFVDESISTDIGLIEFITGFLGKYTAQGGGDPLPRRFLKINLESMSKFVDPQELKHRVKIIVSSPIYNKFNSRNKLTISLFLEEKNKIEINDKLASNKPHL